MMIHHRGGHGVMECNILFLSLITPSSATHHWRPGVDYQQFLTCNKEFRLKFPAKSLFDVVRDMEYMTTDSQINLELYCNSNIS